MLCQRPKALPPDVLERLGYALVVHLVMCHFLHDCRPSMIDPAGQRHAINELGHPFPTRARPKEERAEVPARL
jgi:hypothetical protein